MPSISNLRIPVSAESVGRGWRENRAVQARRRALALLPEILREVESERLLEPALSYLTWRIDGVGTGWLELCDQTCLHSPLLAHRLRNATHLAAGVCTLGNRLAREVSHCFADGQPLKAVLLDEIGSQALYRLSDQLEDIIRAEARRMGLEAGGVLNPGDDGFGLESQGRVVALAGGSDIGIRVTDGAALSPVKSLTLVMGIGRRMPHWRRGDSCGVCRARERCTHRGLAGERRTA